MNTILLAACTGILAAIIVQSDPYQWVFQRLPQKPFRCSLCIAFWCFIAWCACCNPSAWPAAGVAALAASLTEKELYRI